MPAFMTSSQLATIYNITSRALQIPALNLSRIRQFVERTSPNLSLPKPLIRESLSGSCFEISFKLRSAPVVFKTDIRNNFPRTVFGCVYRSTSVVCLETLLKVRCHANVTLGGDGKASEQIDILHDCPPTPIPLR